MDYAKIHTRIEDLAKRFAAERPTRQRRTALEPADFSALRDAGYLLVAVPEKSGGAFVDLRSAVRPLSAILRTLGRSDPSVALVCAMHPAVLSYWLAFPTVSAEHAAAWQMQREELFRHAREGAFFGTITSEPGSGGDIALTKAVAERVGVGYALSGQKHFGSGSGVTSFMVTSAIPDGEADPDWFLLDVRNAAWDGSSGMTLLAPWEGQGMAATQSHGMLFTKFPAMRCAWRGHRKDISDAAGPFIGCLFAAVICGVVDSAIELVQTQLGSRRSELRPFEQVELVRAETDAWLVAQSLAGMLSAAESQPPQAREVMHGKLAIAELGESCLRRLCRVVGGGSYSLRSPLGYLFEDVRALGFLRPPWGLAYDQLIAASS